MEFSTDPKMTKPGVVNCGSAVTNDLSHPLSTCGILFAVSTHRVPVASEDNPEISTVVACDLKSSRLSVVSLIALISADSLASPILEGYSYACILFLQQIDRRATASKLIFHFNLVSGSGSKLLFEHLPLNRPPSIIFLFCTKQKRL